MADDLTIAEARAAFRALAAAMGSKAYFSASLRGEDATLLMAGLYPKGITGRECFYVYADTWADLVAKARGAWAEKSGVYTATTMRAMALKIIEITADIGECTDAALRATFGADEVERFADAAAEQANALAAGGPFSVTITTGANARAA